MFFFLPHIFGIIRPRIDYMVYLPVANGYPLFRRPIIVPLYDGIVNLVVNELDELVILIVSLTANKTLN